MGVPVYKRILDLFEAEGVNTLFGIPDPNFVHMFAEAEARGWTVVAPHHEESAGFMAEAASRMTGKPGLCIATLGSGLKAINSEGAPYQAGFGTPEEIGRLLLTDFLLPFEVASYLLLVAAVGGVVLARRRRGLEETGAAAATQVAQEISGPVEPATVAGVDGEAR